MLAGCTAGCTKQQIHCLFHDSDPEACTYKTSASPVLQEGEVVNISLEEKGSELVMTALPKT